MSRLRAREMPTIRVKLDFDQVCSRSNARAVKNSWLLLDQASCRIIADLEHLIKSRFQIAKNCSLTLLLDNFVLPAQEKIEILRDNDTVKVQQRVVPSSKEGKQISTGKRPFRFSSLSSTSDSTSSSDGNKQKKAKLMKPEIPRIVRKQPLPPVASSQTSSESDSDSEENSKASTQKPGVTAQQRTTGTPSMAKNLENLIMKKIMQPMNGQKSNVLKKASAARNVATSKPSSSSSSSDSSSSDLESSSSETTSSDNAKGKTMNTPRTKSKSTPTVFINNSAVISKDHNYSKSNKGTDNNKKHGLKNTIDKTPEPKLTSTPWQASPAKKSPLKESSTDKSGKSLPQQHIRFDEEEEEDKEGEEKRQNGSDETKREEKKAATVTNNNTAEIKSTAETIKMELVNSANKDYSKYELLHGAPRVGDTVAYKILELSESYTPEISEYKEGKVLSYDPSVQAVVLELTEQSLQRSKGDGTLSRRFELEEEENEPEEPDKRVTVCWSEMVLPRLVK